MKEISNTRPDVLLLVAGEGPLHSGLSEIIRKKKLADNVRCSAKLPTRSFGFITARPTFLSCQLWLTRGWEWRRLEALASGLPAWARPSARDAGILNQLDRSSLCRAFAKNDGEKNPLVFGREKSATRFSAKPPAPWRGKNIHGTKSV